MLDTTAIESQGSVEFGLGGLDSAVKVSMSYRPFVLFYHLIVIIIVRGTQTPLAVQKRNSENKSKKS
jgi:hypothetical protein